MSEETKEFNLMEAAAELTQEGTEAEASSEPLTEGQPEEALPKSEGEKELSPEELLKQAVEQSKGETPAEIAALPAELQKLIHNGQGVLVKDALEAKKLMQQGYDYTKKTMALSDERAKFDQTLKEKETYFAQKEQELETVKFENNIMENLLLKWKESDPELVNYIANQYQAAVREYEQQKPLISKYENRFKEYDQKIAELSKQKEEDKLGEIKQGWEKELASVQSEMASDLKSIGLVPNWKDVEKLWSASNDPAMDVKKALYAVHGQDIANLSRSKINNLQAKAKAMSGKLNRSGVGANSSKSSAPTIKAEQVGNYESILRQAEQQL